VSGCNGHYKFVLGAKAKVEERSDEIPPGGTKTMTTCPARREKLNHIVRVMLRFLLKSDIETKWFF
jgi:hypothetical protein